MGHDAKRPRGACQCRQCLTGAGGAPSVQITGGDRTPRGRGQYRRHSALAERCSAVRPQPCRASANGRARVASKRARRSRTGCAAPAVWLPATALTFEFREIGDEHGGGGVTWLRSYAVAHFLDDRGAVAASDAVARLGTEPGQPMRVERIVFRRGNGARTMTPDTLAPCPSTRVRRGEPARRAVRNHVGLGLNPQAKGGRQWYL